MTSKKTKRTKDQTESNQQSSGQSPPIQLEAIYESRHEDLLDEAESRISKKSFLQTKKGKLIAGLGIFFVIMIGILLILMRAGGGDQFIPEPEPEPININELTPLQQKVEDLRERLDQSDPADRETPFPNVDMDIRVGEEEN